MGLSDKIFRFFKALRRSGGLRLPAALLTISIFTLAAQPLFSGAAERVERISEASDKVVASQDGRISDGEKNARNAGFGIKIAEVPIGTAENQLGIVRDPEKGVPFGMFYGPSSFFADRAGRIFIIDCLNYRVLALDRKNGFIRDKGLSYFTDEEHSSMMSDIFVDDSGFVYLGDFRNHCVIKFSPAGEPVAAYGAPEAGKFKGIGQVDEIACDRKGRLFVRDHSAHAVYMFGSDGKYCGEIKFGAGLYFTSDNLHPFVEFHDDDRTWKIYLENEKGETVRFIHQIAMESKEQNVQLIGIDNEDNVYVKVFRFEGITIHKIGRDGKPSAVYAAHNEPGFDTTRYFFVDGSRGAVLAARFNGKNIEINEMERSK